MSEYLLRGYHILYLFMGIIGYLLFFLLCVKKVITGFRAKEKQDRVFLFACLYLVVVLLWLWFGISFAYVINQRYQAGMNGWELITIICMMYFGFNVIVTAFFIISGILGLIFKKDTISMYLKKIGFSMLQMVTGVPLSIIKDYKESKQEIHYDTR